MSYSKKDIFLSIMLMLFIITLAIVFTVFFKQLYYFDIDYLHIDTLSGMSEKVIKENYDILINYQSIFYQGAFLILRCQLVEKFIFKKLKLSLK